MDDRDEQIRQRAHALWQEEGEPEGRDREHWEQAEREIGPAVDDLAFPSDEAPPAEEPAAKTKGGKPKL